MHPILFEEPWAGRPIYSYGFLLGLALVVGINLALWRSRDSGVALEARARGILVVAIAALLGSRALYLLGDPARIAAPAEWARVGAGGLVAYGGFLGGVLGAWLAFRRRPGFLAAADFMVPGVALGLAVTRLGCFLNGCDFGTPSAVPWAVRFPGASPAWEWHLRSGTMLEGTRVTPSSDGSLPVHPTQLYEAGLGLALFAVLLLAARRGVLPGRRLLLAAIIYGLGRALIEVWRGDPLRGAVGPLSTSQLLGLATAALASVTWILLSRRLRPLKSAPA